MVGGGGGGRASGGGGQQIVRKKIMIISGGGAGGSGGNAAGFSSGGGAASAANANSVGRFGGVKSVGGFGGFGGGSSGMSRTGGGFGGGGSRSTTTIIRRGGGFSGSGGGFSSKNGISNSGTGGSSSGGSFGLGLRARTTDESDDTDNYDYKYPNEEVLYIPLEQYGKFNKNRRYERSLPDITNMQMIHKFPANSVPWIEKLLHHEQYSHRDTMNQENLTGKIDNSFKHRKKTYALPTLIEKYYEARNKNQNLIQRRDMNQQF
ncbi:unnamed protein product [Larinioides sclopetarius]|uniref:Uncharacterized protein n=1 Tax=Larinioides sclopetarius TaxID=280406 RepID=A0AAV1YY71_9ARAC